MGFALSILVWSRARVGFFSLGLGYVALLFGGVASLFLFGFLSSFLLFFFSLVRGGLGVLDHGAGLMVCLFFFFSYTLHFLVGHIELCTFRI